MNLTFLTDKSDRGTPLYRSLRRLPALGGQYNAHSEVYETLRRSPLFTSLASFPPLATHEPSTPNNIFPWFHSHHISLKNTMQFQACMHAIILLDWNSRSPTAYIAKSFKIAQISPPCKAVPDCSRQRQLLHPGESHSIMHPSPITHEMSIREPCTS